jgi:hypothetical protein
MEDTILLFAFIETWKKNLRSPLRWHQRVLAFNNEAADGLKGWFSGAPTRRSALSSSKDGGDHAAVTWTVAALTALQSLEIIILSRCGGGSGGG